MTKICLISDLHVGSRSDNSYVYQNMIEFYQNQFFPELKKRQIKTIINLGDTFDRRKMTNNKTLQNSKEDIFKYFNEFDCHFLIGNHDCPNRNSNHYNTVKSLLPEFRNIKSYENPTTVNIEGLNICLIPWINNENYDDSMKQIENTNSLVCMGHLEIAGFEFYTGSICKHGLSTSIFNKFSKTFSGHFHKKSSNGNITYLGSPYQTTWQEYTEIKGYHIFDTKTFEMEFVPNNNPLLYMIDSEFDFNSDISGKFVKAVLTEEFSKSKDFELYRERIQEMKPATFTTKIIDKAKIENLSLNSDIEINDLNIVKISKDYIDEVENLLYKDELKELLENLHKEAIS